LTSGAIVFRSFIRSRFPEREGVSALVQCASPVPGVTGDVE
jgi:hypothetical protein